MTKYNKRADAEKAMRLKTNRAIEKAEKKVCPLIGKNCMTLACMSWREGGVVSMAMTGLFWCGEVGCDNPMVTGSIYVEGVNG